MADRAIENAGIAPNLSFILLDLQPNELSGPQHGPRSWIDGMDTWAHARLDSSNDPIVTLTQRRHGYGLLDFRFAICQFPCLWILLDVIFRRLYRS